MSLRIKIISLFVISLLLTSTIAFQIIQHNLKKNYLEIEHKEAISQLNHLVRNIDDDLVQLNQMNSDWAVWDEMYRYTQKPTSQFTESQVNPASLGTIGVTFAFIQDKSDRTMYFQTSYNISTKDDSLAIFSKVLDDVRWVNIRHLPAIQNCGIDTTDLGPVYVCWQEIHMTNGAGDGGTLIFGKLIDSAVIDRLTSNTGIRFTLRPIIAKEEKVPQKAIQLFDADSIHFGDDESNQLSAKLFNIMGQHIIEIKLNYSNEISQQGDTIKTVIMQTIVAVILINAAILLAGVHLVLVRRLKLMVKELKAVQKNAKWSGFITTFNDSDELHEIGQAINQMFILIRDQTNNLE